MSSLQEIESAIGSLSHQDRVKLVQDLPSLLPEWEGELAWAKILNNPTPNIALSRMVDEVDAAYGRNPEIFPEIKDTDFGQSK